MTMTSNVLDETATTIKQAVQGFLLSCKAEGKPFGNFANYSPEIYQRVIVQPLNMVGLKVIFSLACCFKTTIVRSCI